MDVAAAYQSLFSRCRRFRVANALLTKGVMDALHPSLEASLARGACGTIIIGLDLFAADPAALRRLLRLSLHYRSQLDCFAFKMRPVGIFHPKLALFDLTHRGRRAILGSSNLSISAWKANAEADVEISAAPDINRLSEQFEAWLDDERCFPLDDGVIMLAEKLWKDQANAVIRRSLIPSSKERGRRIASWRKRDPRIPDRIKGHTFAITGVFEPKGGPRIRREPDLVDEVASHGGRLLVHTKSAASADFFIVASPSMYPGNYRGAKQELADERGTPEMTQEEFWELLQHERQLAARRSRRRRGE